MKTVAAHVEYRSVASGRDGVYMSTHTRDKKETEIQIDQNGNAQHTCPTCSAEFHIHRLSEQEFQAKRRQRRLDSLKMAAIGVPIALGAVGAFFCAMLWDAPGNIFAFAAGCMLALIASVCVIGGIAGSFSKPHQYAIEQTKTPQIAPTDGWQFSHGVSDQP